MEAYLQTEDLAVGYQGRTLIGEISLAVQRGRIVTLIGPNGSGKSTILKTIIGQLPSISGSVFLDGADMRSRSRGDVARRMAILMTARMDPEEDTETGLSHQVTCETPGAAANNYGGTLIPVEYVQGLTHAELVELLIPGDDEEETEAFRQRVLDSFQSQAFGGNQADYREKVLAMPGVGDLKIHPVWNGDISPASLIPDEAVESWYTSTISTVSGSVATWLTAVYTAAKEKKLTVGGTVKLVIMASDYKAPTPTLLEEIQTAIDPEQNAGEGLGLAPIGHVVHVTGVTPEEVDIALHLTYASGWDWDAVKSYVEAVIDAYFVELSQDWASSDFLTVRISQIESRILSECSNMITDIGGTKINGQENNLALGPDSIPARGEVTDG